MSKDCDLLVTDLIKYLLELIKWLIKAKHVHFVYVHFYIHVRFILNVNFILKLEEIT